MTRANILGRKRGSRGFTMMEALMALMMLFLAILGMGAMAGTAVKTNMDAHDRTRATFLANKVIAMMQTEALQWNDTSWNPDIDMGSAANADAYMKLLGDLDATGELGFTELGTVLEGAPMAFTPDLEMVDPSEGGALYCVHYNLTWLQLNESIRADVRVYWMRRGANPEDYAFYTECGANNVEDLGTNITDVYCVTASTILSRNGGS